MPGVLVGDTSTDPALALPAFAHSPLPHLCNLRRYGPVLTRSVMPDFCSDVELPLSQLSPLPRPTGLNVSLLPDICADDGSSLDPNLLLQLSPASAGQWGCNNASPTTLSALSALRQFLPSNFEEDEGRNSPHLEMYAGDEFRMYEFKVRRCTRGRSHDWTECPFAHPGEKARRRDPRRFHYSGTACVDFRRGSCKKGDACEYAHGVFECWLHPSRYRTQPCKDGRGCRRRICFFAHTHDQLRLGSSVSSVSALSSSTSLHFCPAMEAFELCGCVSPTRSPVKKAISESLKSPHTTSPLSRMAMEAPSGGCFMSNFALTSPSTHSPPSSPPSSTPLTSSPMAHINWSLSRGVSTFALPAPMMPHLHPSWDLNQTQASLTLVPTQGGHWERHNQSRSLPIPQVQGGSKSALPSSTSTTLYTTTQVTEQVEKNAMLWPGGHSSMPETSTKKGCSRTSEEETLLGQFCDEEDEAEPKLERVESGKGLRAQIFQNLLRSSCQPSCCTYQESNLEPLSSSSLGF